MDKEKPLRLRESCNNTGIFPTIKGLYGFVEAFRQNWPVILSIGLFFGWLLSFPMKGPLFGTLVQAEPVSPVLLTTMFLFGHILGLAMSGITGFFLRQKLVWFSFGAVPCIIITGLFNGTAPEYWWLLFVLLGLFAGLSILSWANAFAILVPLNQRGHTFALAAVIANLVLYLVTLFNNQQTNFNLLLLVTGILPLGMTVFLFFSYRRINSDMSVESPAEATALPTRTPEFWQLFPFIFAIYAVGGLMYAVVGNLITPSPAFFNYFGLIPYIVFLFIAGILADRVGRRINAVIGAVAAGIGFMVVGLLTGSAQFILIHTLLVGGYAFLDVFTWVIPADASSGRKVPLFYSAVLGTNILAIIFGVLLDEKMGQLAAGSEILTVSLAGVFSLISLTLMIRLRETLQPRPTTEINLPPDYIDTITQKFELTPRELDILKLLMNGAGTKEILEELVIAPDTLKTHLRNIFRKAGVRNRLELTLAIMNTFRQPGVPADTNPK